MISLLVILVGAVSFAVGNAFGFSAGMTAQHTLEREQEQDTVYICGHCHKRNRFRAKLESKEVE